MGWDAGPAPHPVGPYTLLAGRWSAALRDGARDHVVPMSVAEADRLLSDLARDLHDCLTVSPPPQERIAAVGARLAGAHFVGNDVLGASVAVLSEHFGGAPALLHAFTTGYLKAFREWLLAEQESIRTAEITARREAEEQLRVSEARLRAVFTQAGIGTGLSDMTGRIIEVNTAFARMLGYRPEQMYAMSVTDLNHPEDPPGMWELYAALMRGELDNVQLEKAYPHRDGHAVWTNLNVSLIRDAQRRPQYTLVLVEDISERRALRERLDYRANHDQLTGLPNRSRFFDALRAAFADPSAEVGLCYIDIDHFKNVNDTYGHAAGDELLAQAGARLRACVALPGQVVARTGGDEFVIMIPRPARPEDVVTLARSVLDALARPFDVHGHHMKITASIGVVENRGSHPTADDLLQAADTTMYWAKSAGRDRYAVFDHDRGRLEHTRAELSAAMPASFTRGEFFLDYQPIVSLDDQRLVAVEALVRWRHPELGVLPPSRFVDLAEDNGHIDALGALVLELATQDSRRWFAEFPDQTPTVSVNVSASEVGDPTWLERVRRIIAETGIPPDRLQLELTERTFMETTGRPLEALRTLAEDGVRIAIDDFGTGYSNLAYLGQLPLHVVKLAGPFVQRIRTPETVNRTDLLVLEAIIGLTHELGLTVTAECVETEYQAERLQGLGCDSAQGWHFHRPMPAHRITELLAAPVLGSR